MVVAALALSLLLKTFVMQSFWIPSPSMEDTLATGDRILVTKWRPGLMDLRRGDMVVFADPGGWLPGVSSPPPTGFSGAMTTAFTFVGLLPDNPDEHLVKRVIGLPGDQVTCTDENAAVHVNGEPVDEPYLRAGSQPCGRVYDITVPEGYLWVLGDNRNNSADSRSHMGRPGGGSIPLTNVVGTVFVTVWPLENWSGHGNPHSE